MSHDVGVLWSVLARLLPDGDQITDVRPLATGHSNETYLIEGLDLILRQPPPSEGALLDNHGVITQARIYDELSAAVGAPPVPSIVLIHEDPALFGAPFFIMEKVLGEPIGDYLLPAWFTEAAPDVRERLCRDWIEAIAKLATLTPLTALGAVTLVEDDLRYWRSLALAVDHPRVAQTIDRLLQSPAPRSGPPAVVHGDPKISNMMFADARLSAVLDFELGQNGDPLYDLGYLLYFFESPHHGAALAQQQTGMLRRDQVIEIWSAASGRSADGLAWYEAAALAKICAILAQATMLIDSGKSDDQRLLRFKKNLASHLDFLDAMIDAAR